MCRQSRSNFLNLGLEKLQLYLNIWVDRSCSFIYFLSKLRERYPFSSANTFKYPKNTFTIAPTTGWRHTVFQHFNKIYVKHHSFLVPTVTELLLFDKAIQLVDWVV